ncbi:MAG: hypothetical protein Q4G70_03740 [Pseudomonadota bacterium]|nr:hypothetical protein [Pseudomonadota bacterium]
MATRSKPAATTPEGCPWHPIQIKILEHSEREWTARMIKKNIREENSKELIESLHQKGNVRIHSINLGLISISYALESKNLMARSNFSFVFSTAINRQADWKALEFRKIAGISLPTEVQPMRAFWYSMKVMQPVMLSHWDEAAACAELLVATAHKEMRVANPLTFPKGWGKGTSDAFNVFLMAQAFGIPCHFKPAKPLIPEYQSVLDHWRTDDLERFQQVMQAAAEYHISRSKGSTNKVEYEFEDVWDQLYPGELLAIQALRRRDGLPEFETGHIYIDTPWSLIRDLPPAEPDPLLEQVIARLKQDYPTFR